MLVAGVGDVGVGDDDNGDDTAKQSYVGIDDDDDLDEQ